jgi:hypothetical protein
MRVSPKPLLQLLLAATLITALTFPSIAPVFADPTSFYFHNGPELTFSYPQFQVGSFQVSGIQANASSLSSRIFSAANSSAPTSGGVAVTGQQSGYGAFVAWVTNPFPSTLTLDGNVTMHVWMSSNASIGLLEGSELFMGIADYSPAGSGQFQLLDDYQSTPGFGNVLTRYPTEYVETLTISQHQFAQGDMIMFFTGVGVNQRGYTFTVYFDDPARPSRADVPADPTLTTPEFPNTILTTTTALLLAFVLIKRRQPRIRLGLTQRSELFGFPESVQHAVTLTKSSCDQSG